MVEIASLPPSPLGPELSSLAHRDERGRKGDMDVVPFGQLVSAQARPAHAQGQPPAPVQPAPAPLDQPVEKPGSQPKPRSARAANSDDKPGYRPECADDCHSAVADDAEAKTSELRKMTQDEKPACDQPGQVEKPAGHCEDPAEIPVGGFVEPVETPADVFVGPAETPVEPFIGPAETPVGPFIGPAETPAGLFVGPADVPAGPFIGPAEIPVAAIALASEGADAQNIQGSVPVATTASTQTQALPGGLPLPAINAEAPVTSAAEAFAKLTTRAAETPVAPRGDASAKGAAAPDLPKANFADWINDFALMQGAHHRSGDLVGSLDRALAAMPTPNVGQDALRPTPLQMLPIEIGMQAMRGVTKFQIRLDPAELGRVDVKLEIREDGQVKANLVVDRVETLAMLKRDAQTLQQAFEQAGLRQSADGLQFSLRGESQQREGQREGEPRRSWSPDDEKLMGELPPELALRRVMIPNSSLDLMV